MNHLKQIAEKLPEYGLDAMLITSEAGERYAIGFHGEGLLLITREETHYTTDGRYIEAAQEQVQGADVKLVTRDSRPGPIWRPTACTTWALRAGR